MCTAAEAKTLQRVYGRYNSFFRKVIPIKRVQKPVRWYTRLTVYGNPGRVVNGCAPGIPVLICGFGVVVCGGGCSGVLRRVDARPRSYRGTRPRFASGTLMSRSDDTAPPPLLNETIRPPGSVPGQYEKPSPPGTDQPTHQPAHQRPGPAE